MDATFLAWGMYEEAISEAVRISRIYDCRIWVRDACRPSKLHYAGTYFTLATTAALVRTSGFIISATL